MTWGARSGCRIVHKAAATPVPGHVEQEFRAYLRYGIGCFCFARVHCTGCGTGSFIGFIADPEPIREILKALCDPLEPPPLAPARGPPDAFGELVQVHDDRNVVQASPDDLPVIEIHSR